MVIDDRKSIADPGPPQKSETPDTVGTGAGVSVRLSASWQEPGFIGLALFFVYRSTVQTFPRQVRIAPL